MKKSLLLILILASVFQVRAQEGGISFEKGSWQEVRQKAIAEKKLIFADFYTEWCGPCLAMAEEVFPSMEVGNLYNAHFVNVKIDAEKGEGRELRDKYRVVSYPTFLFIDPVTGEIVHRSSSRQDQEIFLFTGTSALDPVLRSVSLEKEYSSGNRSRLLLGRYMDYLASMYKREQVEALVKEYAALSDFSLENKADWGVFLKHINGTENSFFQEVLNQRDKYIKLYTSEMVDGKLFREFNIPGDMEALRNAPDFQGKEFLILKNEAEHYLREKNYQVAIPLLDSLMKEPGDFKEELCRYLKFTARSVLYGEHPDFWLKKCAEHAQFVAYNSYDRQDATIHYDYAMILEKLIRSVPDAARYFPASIVEQPEKGTKGYSMRSPKLKQKPRKK